MEFKRVQLPREAGACSFGGMIQEDLSQEVTVRPRLRTRSQLREGDRKGYFCLEVECEGPEQGKS